MTEDLTPQDGSPLDRAVKALGTQQALAVALGVKSPSISEWRSRGRVPAERCVEIERLTGGQVLRHELRPDLWPVDSGDQQEPNAAAA